MAQPKLVRRLVSQLRRKGMSAAYAHATAIKTLRRSGSLKRGSTKLTAKGRGRTRLGAAGRAKSRAAKASGRKPSAYRYSRRTNRATLKRRRR